MVWWLTTIVIVLILFFYCAFPVIWTRTFHQSCVRFTGKPGTFALTFDDGPHPVYTPRLLDVLKELNVQATFFVLAQQAIRYRDIVDRMIREGHAVQVHGSRHWFVPLLHPRAAFQQCIGAARQLETHFPLQNFVYRPTWGACNAVTLYLMHRYAMRLYTWSVMVGDWRKLPAGELVRRIESKLEDGSILVLHDNDDTAGAEHGAPEQVIAAMPAIAALVRAKGLQFVTVANVRKEG